MSQSSTKVVVLETELKERYPHLNIKRLIGSDSGETKRQALEDINETLEDVNVFLYSPVIESGVDITVKVKKVYGLLCSSSNSQRAFLQMINRCRCVEDPNMDFLNDGRLRINSNYNFWKYAEVMELNQHTVTNTRPEFLIEDGRMRVAENEANSKRKSISVFNTVERLNKHPSVFINYLRVLANAKGMTFNIQYPPTEEEPATEDQAAAPQKKKTKVESMASSIAGAKDLTQEEYDEISKRKMMGKTTTDENLQAEKHYWQNFFLTNALYEAVLKDFLYGTNPLQNYVGLIDARNHEKEDNLKSEKQPSKIEIVRALLERLGWDSARDEGAIREGRRSRRRFANNVVDAPLFKRQKRLNELVNLNKSYNIRKEMTPQQVLMWCNSLLKDFSLQIRADKETYYLELQNDLLTLTERKNKIGKI